MSSGLGGGGIGALLANKTLLAAIGCIAVIAIAGAIAIPIILDDKDNDNGHEHKFATTLTYDDQSHWYACTVDGCSETSEKTAHTLTEEIIKAATHTEDGSKKSVCVCGYEKNEVIPKHVISNVYSKNDEKHWYACTAEGCPVTEGDAAHVLAEETVKAATHYEDGSKKSVCVCGYEKTETIPKHILKNTYSYDEENHWYDCTECDIKDKNKHVCDVNDMTVITPAKEGTVGVLDGKCTVCNNGFTKNVYATMSKTSVMYDGKNVDINQLVGFYKLPTKTEYANKSDGTFTENVPCNAGEYSVKFTFDNNTQIIYNFKILPSILAVSGDITYETHVSKPAIVVLTGLDNPKYCTIDLPKICNDSGIHEISLTDLNTNNSNFILTCNKDKIKIDTKESVGAQLLITNYEDTEDGLLVSGIVIKGIFKANITTSDGYKIKNVYDQNGGILSIINVGTDAKILIEEMHSSELEGSTFISTEAMPSEFKFKATVYLITEDNGGPSKEFDGTVDEYGIYAFKKAKLSSVTLANPIKPGNNGTAEFATIESLCVETSSAFYLMFEDKIVGYGIVQEILETA